MKDLYAVQGKTSIDGGAPGYFSVAFFEKKDDAEKICNYLNEKLRNGEYTLNFDFTQNNPFAYGYEEGLYKSYNSNEYFFVKKVHIPDNTNEWFDKVKISKIEW